MKKFLLGGLAAAGLLLGGLTIANSASASNTSHVLVVNGVSYNSYKETAADPNDPNDIGTVQWQTPNVTTSAIVTFAERNQTWNGVNGANLLPCQFGVHWISNGSKLTISHCLAETEATTTTSTTSTTSTVPVTVPADTVPPVTSVPAGASPVVVPNTVTTVEDHPEAVHGKRAGSPKVEDSQEHANTTESVANTGPSVPETVATTPKVEDHGSSSETTSGGHSDNSGSRHTGTDDGQSKTDD